MARYEEAVADLTRAIGLDPGYAWAFGERGETYRLMGRHEEAVADLTRAIGLNPGMPGPSAAAASAIRPWPATRRRWRT